MLLEKRLDRFDAEATRVAAAEAGPEAVCVFKSIIYEGVHVKLLAGFAQNVM